MQTWEEKIFSAAGRPEWEGQESSLCGMYFIYLDTYIKNDFCLKKKSIPRPQDQAGALHGDRREATFSRERAGGQCEALSNSGCRGAWRGSPCGPLRVQAPASPSQPPGPSRSPSRGFRGPRENPASGAGPSEVSAGRPGCSRPRGGRPLLGRARRRHGAGVDGRLASRRWDAGVALRRRGGPEPAEEEAPPRAAINALPGLRRPRRRRRLKGTDTARTACGAPTCFHKALPFQLQLQC